jgi:hypothetical protein
MWRPLLPVGGQFGLNVLLHDTQRLQSTDQDHTASRMDTGDYDLYMSVVGILCIITIYAITSFLGLLVFWIVGTE